MPSMVAISRVVPAGTIDAAARSKLELNEPARRLPEIPTILAMKGLLPHRPWRQLEYIVAHGAQPSRHARGRRRARVRRRRMLRHLTDANPSGSRRLGAWRWRRRRRAGLARSDAGHVPPDLRRLGRDRARLHA